MRKKNHFGKISSLIIGEGYNANNLSNVLPQSPPTIRKKLNNPELFTLNDLRIIASDGHVSMEEFAREIGRV